MAKNLYNLAVTTVNDSDLLHVNQGGVSSDKKVTKQNLLKEVNSSITSLNNSLANIGSRNVSHYAQHATSATMAYTGVSFTITKKSIVRADLYYTYSTPQEIAICGSSSGNQSFYAHATAVANMTNVMLSCTAVLDPGTFYVWARSGASANNNIGLYGIQIEP